MRCIRVIAWCSSCFEHSQSLKNLPKALSYCPEAWCCAMEVSTAPRHRAGWGQPLWPNIENSGYTEMAGNRREGEEKPRKTHRVVELELKWFYHWKLQFWWVRASLQTKASTFGCLLEFAFVIVTEQTTRLQIKSCLSGSSALTGPTKISDLFCLMHLSPATNP